MTKHKGDLDLNCKTALKMFKKNHLKWLEGHFEMSCATQKHLSKKVRACSFPGNGTKTLKYSTKRDTNIQTELQEPTKAEAVECTESCPSN